MGYGGGAWNVCGMARSRVAATLALLDRAAVRHGWGETRDPRLAAWSKAAAAVASPAAFVSLVTWPCDWTSDSGEEEVHVLGAADRLAWLRPGAWLAWRGTLGCPRVSPTWQEARGTNQQAPFMGGTSVSLELSLWRHWSQQIRMSRPRGQQAPGQSDALQLPVFHLCGWRRGCCTEVNVGTLLWSCQV